MSKYMQYTIELSPEESERFLARWLAKPSNPARDATIERARKLHFELP